ncbi:MAG: DNA polymerase IV, partial [Myxococcota bacterium]
MPPARTILHIDMDAFFASVEQLDDPALRGKPLLVGGAPPRGVVAAASYEARPFGCRSAMPMALALRKCPHARVVPPRHDRYMEVSRRVFAIFHRHTPLVEKLSVDEAFLDVTASRSLFGGGEAIARRIKDTVRAELGLTGSAGVAPSKFVAKIASDLDKPDGLVVVPPERVEAFLAPLPLDRMWGVGPKAAERLRARGYATLGDLARARPRDLERLLGSWGARVQALARGQDDRPVVPDAPAKSIGAEETFDRDLTGRDALRRELLAQADRVAARLVAAGVCGRVITIKVKYADFTLRTRQKRLPAPVADTDSIYEAARDLLDRFEGLERGVRLTGVAVGDLQPGPPPPTLFPEPRAERRQRLEEAVQAVRSRFGRAGITRGTLIRQTDPNTSQHPREPEASPAQHPREPKASPASSEARRR